MLSTLCLLFLLSAPFLFLALSLHAFLSLTFQLYQLFPVETSFAYSLVTEVLCTIKVDLQIQQYDTEY